jgi:hypothetical protein
MQSYPRYACIICLAQPVKVALWLETRSVGVISKALEGVVDRLCILFGGADESMDSSMHEQRSVFPVKGAHHQLAVHRAAMQGQM